MFAEVAKVPMPVPIGEALAKRKAHIERSREAGWTAEEDWQQWRYAVTAGKWRLRQQLRAEKNRRLMHHARTTIGSAPRVSM